MITTRALPINATEAFVLTCLSQMVLLARTAQFVTVQKLVNQGNARQEHLLFVMMETCAMALNPVMP